MKKAFIVIFTLLIFSIACTKNNTVLTNSKSEKITSENLSGTWILKQAAGGISYMIIIPTDKNTLTFNNSNNYISSKNDTIISQGKYNISQDSSGYYYSTVIINLIDYNDYKITYGINLRNDSLFLSEGCCDAYSYTYIRQQ